MHVRGAKCLATRLPPSCASASRNACGNGNKDESVKRRDEQSVWISDEMLGEAVRRFWYVGRTADAPAPRYQQHPHRPTLRTRGASIRLPTHVTRRHGSHIPGPLEAQRRLAKRRMAGLAHAGPSPGAGVDPFALFGSKGPRVGKMIWEAPDLDRARRESKEKVLFSNARENDMGAEELGIDPGWLKKLAEKFSGKRKKSEGMSTSADTDRGHDMSMELSGAPKIYGERAMQRSICQSFAQGQTIWQQLEHAKTLKSCHKLSYLKLLSEHARDDERIEFSQDAFQVVLDDDVLTFSTYHLFLLDSKLNQPEARNLTRLYDNFEKTGYSSDDLDDLFHTQYVYLKFAAVPTEEVHDIIRRTGRLSPIVQCHETAQSDRNTQISSRNINPRQLYVAYHSLLSGLKEGPTKAPSPNTIELFLSEVCSHGETGFQSFKGKFLSNLFTLRFKPFDTEGSELPDAIVDWLMQTALPQTGPSSCMTHGTLRNLLSRLYPEFRSDKPLAACLPPDTLSDMAELLLLKLKHEQISHNDRKHVIQHFLFLLNPLSNSGQLNPVLEVFSRELSLSDLSHFLKTRKHAEICQTILRFWLPKVSLYRQFDNLKEQSLQYQDMNPTLKRDAVMWGKTYSKYIHLQRSSQKTPSPISPFACLLIALHHRNQLSLQAQSAIIEVMKIAFNKRPGKFVGILEDVRAKNVYLYPVLFADVFEHVAFQETESHLVGRLIDVTRVYISRFAEVLPRIVAGFSPKSIARVLAYSDPMHTASVPNGAEMLLVPSEERNLLVHDLAHAFSNYEGHNLSKRLANVHQCYRYLKDRKSPINPTMTRALVRTAITAPLSQWQFVHESRIKWILDLVAKTEGLQIASELDTLVWRWRNNVQKYRTAYFGAHGSTPSRFGVLSARQQVVDTVFEEESEQTVRSFLKIHRRWNEPQNEQYILAPFELAEHDSSIAFSERDAALREKLAKFRQALHKRVEQEFIDKGLKEHFEWQGAADECELLSL